MKALSFLRQTDAARAPYLSRDLPSYVPFVGGKP